MDIDIEIANTTRRAVSKDLVKKIAQQVIMGEIGQTGGLDIEISFAFVGPQKMRALNLQWRKIDRVTDVLSFAQDDFLRRFSKKSLLPHEFLGEIVICLDQVSRDAKELKVKLSHELAWVVAHGVLHLFGYDHEAKDAGAIAMRQKEKEYLG